jgi:hypothetical protein
MVESEDVKELGLEGFRRTASGTPGLNGRGATADGETERGDMALAKFPGVATNQFTPSLRASLISSVQESAVLSIQQARNPSVLESLGPIAQRSEPPAHNRPVPGSNPGGPTISSSTAGRRHRYGNRRAQRGQRGRRQPRGRRAPVLLVSRADGCRQWRRMGGPRWRTHASARVSGTGRRMTGQPAGRGDSRPTVSARGRR